MVVDRKQWWQTSLGSASWTSDNSVKGLIASPLFYRLSESDSDTALPPKLEDVSLNPDHLACSLAEAAIASYEEDVGFGFSIYPAIDHKDNQMSSPFEPTSDSRERARRVFRLAALKRLIQMLKEGQETAVECTPSLDNDDSLSSSLTDSTCTKPHSSNPVNRSLLSLDSENSGDFFAMPATPVSKVSYANVLLKNVSPSSSVSDESPVATPSKQLSPFATSFVPGSAEASGVLEFTYIHPSSSSSCDGVERLDSRSRSPPSSETVSLGWMLGLRSQ